MDPLIDRLCRVLRRVDLDVLHVKAKGYDAMRAILDSEGSAKAPNIDAPMEASKPEPAPVAPVPPVAAEAPEAPEEPEEPDELEAVWPKPKPLPEAVSPVVPVPAEDPTPAQKRGRGRPKKSAPAEMPPDIEEPPADPVVAPGPIGALVVDGPADSPPAGDLQADPDSDF
jgi:outer membrane biosynthesis protein TonB